MVEATGDQRQAALFVESQAAAVSTIRHQVCREFLRNGEVRCANDQVPAGPKPTHQVRDQGPWIGQVLQHVQAQDRVVRFQGEPTRIGRHGNVRAGQGEDGLGEPAAQFANLKVRDLMAGEGEVERIESQPVAVGQNLAWFAVARQISADPFAHLEFQAVAIISDQIVKVAIGLAIESLHKFAPNVRRNVLLANRVGNDTA
jgi:hypothetical protein